MAVRNAARSEELFGGGIGGCLGCRARLGLVVHREGSFSDNTFSVGFACLREEENG